MIKVFQWKCFCEVRDSPRWPHCIKYWCRAPPLKIEGCLMWAWPSFFAACAAQANFLAAHFKIMYGIRSLAKQIQSSAFNKSLHCHKMLMQMKIPRVLCLRHSYCLFCLPRTLLGLTLWFSSLPALGIWLHFLTEPLMCPAQVKVWTGNHKHLTFFGIHLCEISFIYVNSSEITLNLQC